MTNKIITQKQQMDAIETPARDDLDTIDCYTIAIVVNSRLEPFAKDLSC